MKKRVVIVSGFSGAGKGTVLKRAMGIEKKLMGNKSRVALSVSDTTRPYRNSSDNYSFISWKEYTDRVAQGYYLEHNEYNGNGYGTPLQTIVNADGIIIMEIDVNGMQQVKESCKLEGTDIITVFVAATADMIVTRLQQRGDGEEEIKNRLNAAETEVKHISEYDYVLVNNDVDETALKLWAIISGIPVSGDPFNETVFLKNRILAI